jgi:ABC-type nitrate/sulfonate/bicarbonate transport system substrate-binding protein
MSPRRRIPPLPTLVLAAVILSFASLFSAPPGRPVSAAAAERAPTSQVVPLSSPATVRVGTVPTVGSMGPFIGIERGYFAEEGLDVVVEMFQTGSEMVPAVGTGQLDVASGAVNAGIFNAIQRGIPLRLVATISSMTPGHGIIGLLVRKDLIDSGAIRDYPDLRGRRIAIPARASVSEQVLDAALARGGLTPRDVDVTEIPLPDMTVALANGAIDVAVQSEPPAAVSVDRGVAVRWRSADELVPDTITGIWVYSAQFADQRTEAARRFMVGLLRAQRNYVNAFDRGIDREAIIQLLIQNTSVKDRAFYDRMVLPAVSADGYVDAAVLQNDLAWYVQRGYVAPGLNAQALIDNQFVDYALARLGRYQ